MADTVSEIIDTPGSQVEAPAQTGTAPQVDTVDSTAIETVSASQPATETPKPADLVEEEEFDFSKWDGNLEAVPSEYKVFAQGVLPKFEEIKRLESEREQLRLEAEEAKLLYHALFNGEEDPRVAQLQAENERIAAEHKAVMDQIHQQEYQAAVKELEEFKAANPSIAKSKKALDLTRDLLAEDFGLDLITQLVNMPKAGLEEVRQLAKSGMPKDKAIEFVVLKSEKESKKPNTAHLVFGADDSRGNAAEMERGTLKKRTYTEARDESIAKAFRKHS
jgi:hypothetical protein